MAYELSCPACSNVQTSPFVRVGAVVLCPKCAGKYRTAEEHIRRTHLPGGGAGSAAAAKPEPIIQVDDELKSSVRNASDGTVIGLSGLSEVMKGEPDAPEPGMDGAEPLPRAKAAAAPAKASSAKPRGNSRRRNVGVLYALLGLMLLGMAGVGAALWYAVMDNRNAQLPPPPRTGDGSRATPPASDGGSDESEPDDGSPASSALAMVTAQLVPDPEWQVESAPYRFEPRVTQAFLRDEARVFAEDGREFYTATVGADGDEIVSRALLRLVLVDMNDRAVARGTVPIMLFGAGRTQKLRVPFPPGLPAGLIRVDSWVEVEERLSTALYMTNVEARPVTASSRTLLRFKARNPGELAIVSANVAVRALDDKGTPIARYTATLPGPIAAGTEVAVRLALPPPGPDQPPARWIADAVGLRTR